MHILFYQILAYTIHGKKYKSHIKNNKFRISAPAWNDIRYLRLYWIYFKIHAEKIKNSSIKICVKETENRIPFKIKTGYYLHFLILESNNSRIAKDKKVKIFPT